MARAAGLEQRSLWSRKSGMNKKVMQKDDAPLWVALVLVLLGMILVAIPAWNYTATVPALGDDASSHTATIATLAQRMIEGRGWWSTDYNLGFPMVLYYQPIPHVVSAMFCAALGGQGAAIVTYKFFMALMILAQPAAVFFGMKRAGATNLQAGFAAALTPCVMNSLKFGYTTFASLKVGLYTQAWGNTMLPLAVGELVALCTRRGRIWSTILTSTLVAGCHMFLAIGIALPVGAFAVLWPLLAASDAGASPQTLLQRARMSAKNVGLLLASAAGVGVMLSAWFIPLFTTRSVMGGWPFGSTQLRNGHGRGPIMESLYTGEFMDGASWFSERIVATGLGQEASSFGDQYVPMLSILAVVGIAWTAARLRREPAAVMTALLFAWSLFGIVGRGEAGFGAIYDWYPLHDSVEVFRYSSLVQFSGLMFAGIGAAGLAMLVQRAGVPSPAHAAVALVVLIQPYVTGYGQLVTGFRTLHQARGLILEEYDELVDNIREQSPEGRLLVGPKTEVRYHYHGGLLTYMSQRPAGQSYGVGLHDSLGFYILEYINLHSARHSMALCDLYDFRYVVRKPSHRLRGLTNNEVIWRTERDRYQLERIPVSGHSAVLMTEAGVRTGTPRRERERIRQWLNGNGPIDHVTWVLDIPDMGDGDDLVGAPRTVNGAEQLELQAPDGEVLESRAFADEASAVVQVNEDALLVFKHGYHPYWTVWVDGQPAESLFAYPGFLAVRLGPGEHDVVARYRWPSWTRLLLWLGVLVFGATAAAEVWWHRRRAG